MSSKYSVVLIVREHYQTLVDAEGRRSFTDYAVTVALPVAAGTAAGVLRLRLQDVGSLVAGAAVLSGVLFALVIFVFQLRLQVAADPRVPKCSHAAALLDELFRNVSYAVVASLVTTVACVAADSTRAVGIGDALRPPSTLWTVLTVAASAHLLLVMAMCLKRIRAVYRTLTK